MARLRTLAVTIMVLLGACSHSENQGYIPAVEIAYASTYDTFCSLLGPAIDDTWRKELDELMPTIRGEWETFGKPVLIRVRELVGRGFEDESYSVGLTLCESPSQDSWSGIRVNMRYALKSFSESPVSLRYKASTIAHELLHEYLREVPVEDSPLLARYHMEPDRVRGHLHLLALLKAAMLESEQRDALEEVVRIDSQLPAGVYKRAWEIVNSSPQFYMQFVEELKGASRYGDAF